MKRGIEERKISKIVGEKTTANGFRPLDRAVPLTEALVRWSLPLLGEMVTTDVSLCGDEGAWVTSGG